MFKKEIIKLLEQDLKDIQGLLENSKYLNDPETVKNLANAINSNIQEHIEELIKIF